MELTAENVSGLYARAYTTTAQVVIVADVQQHAWQPTSGMTFVPEVLLSSRQDVLHMMAQLSPGCREHVSPATFSSRADGSIWGDDYVTMQLLCLMFALGFVCTSLNGSGQPMLAIKAEYYQPWLVQSANKSDIDAGSESQRTEGGDNLPGP